MFVLHGKASSSFLLQLTDDPFSQKYGWQVYLVLLLSSTGLVALRRFSINQGLKALIAVFLGALGSFLSTMYSEHPSSLVLFLKLFLFSAVIFVIYMETFLSKNLSKEFWKIMTESITKGIRYIIALFLGGFALLQYLSEGVGESRDGFLTTFIYPSITMVLSFFVLGYWLFLPAWEKMVECYERKEFEAGSERD